MLKRLLRPKADGLDDGPRLGLAPGCGGCDSVEGSAYSAAGRNLLLRVGTAALGVDLFVWQLLLLLHAYCQLLYTCELPLQVLAYCIEMTEKNSSKQSTTKKHHKKRIQEFGDAFFFFSRKGIATKY